MLAIATHENWKIHQLDVKFFLLNRPLEKQVYVNHLYGYEIIAEEQKPSKKALYGLKQALRDRNKRIDSFFSQFGFTKCSYEHRLYVKLVKNYILIIYLYVDDLMLIGDNERQIENFRDKSKTRI